MDEENPQTAQRVGELCSILLQLAPALNLNATGATDSDKLGQALRVATELRDAALGMHAERQRAELRLNELMSMLTALVSFDFARRAKVHDEGDIYDAFALSLNMVAEELATRAVSKEYVDNIIHTMSDLLIVTDPAGRIRDVNAAACRLSESTNQELVGHAVIELFPGAFPEDFNGIESFTLEESVFQKKTGELIPVSVAVSLMSNDVGETQGLVCVARDLTERKRREEEERRRLQQIVESQAVLLQELSTPLIPISDDILVMPVIGSVDARRASQIMESILDGVVARQARLVVIDITGVSKIDESGVRGLTNAVKGVRLLGARVALTGVRPEVARALLDLNLNLSDIVTLGSLQSGIAYAMQQLRTGSKKRP